MPPYREQHRQRLREHLIAHARELAVVRGWGGVRMVDVAANAGVSRQTVYNESGDKSGLAEALAAAETLRFTSAVQAELVAHGADLRAAAHAAVTWTLAEAASNRLLKSILTGTPNGEDDLLPYLTTRADLVVKAGSQVIVEWAATVVPEADSDAVAQAAESVVRLVLSHIVLPTTPIDQVAAAIADILTRLLR